MLGRAIKRVLFESIVISVSQPEIAETFRQLHEGPESFIIGNVFDAVFARIYQASVTRSQHRAADLRARLAGATDLPVSADFENGFSDKAEYVAETLASLRTRGWSGAPSKMR